jgi:hypothetical protein
MPQMDTFSPDSSATEGQLSVVVTNEQELRMDHSAPIYAHFDVPSPVAAPIDSGIWPLSKLSSK